MAERAQLRARDDRHWLPTQGVDPGPLHDLNAECLGLLALRAAELAPGAPAAPLPPLVGALRERWAALSSIAVRRLASAPFSLFDAGFPQATRWLELRVRGVHDHPVRAEATYFEPVAARSITRRMLVYGWHLARSRPRAACLVFGAPIAAVDAVAACSLNTLELAAELTAEQLRPRWPGQVAYWRELLAAASAGADERLRELMLGGVQRLAADTLAAHPA